MNRLMKFFHGATDFADVAVSVTLGAHCSETANFALSVALDRPAFLFRSSNLKTSQDIKSFYELKAADIDKKEIDFSSFKGQVKSAFATANGIPLGKERHA